MLHYDVNYYIAKVVPTIFDCSLFVLLLRLMLMFIYYCCIYNEYVLLSQSYYAIIDNLFLI